MTLVQRIKYWLGLLHVDSAIAGITKALKKLEESQEFHKLKAEAHTVAADVQAKAAAFATEEAARAKKIYENIEKLIS